MQANLQLLAACYLQSNHAYSAYHILKGMWNLVFVSHVIVVSYHFHTCRCIFGRFHKILTWANELYNCWIGACINIIYACYGGDLCHPYSLMIEWNYFILSMKRVIVIFGKITLVYNKTTGQLEFGITGSFLH